MRFGSTIGGAVINDDAPLHTRIMYRDRAGTTSVTLTGFVDPNYALTTVSFEYGTAADLSAFTTVSAFESPVSGGSAIPVSGAVTGLVSGMTYYFRIVASNTNGTTSGSITSFTTYAQPTITEVMPSRGSTVGESIVTITGANLTGTSSVMFGDIAATSITSVSATSVTVITPANLGETVDVILTTPGGSATRTKGFTYVVAPTITGVTPSGGPIAGGTTVTITGTNLKDTKAVMFGDIAGTSLNVVSATSATVITPAQAVGAVDVALVKSDGLATGIDEFTYVASPIVTSVTPSSGPIAGGTTVTIIGTNLTDTSSVMFGDFAGTSVTVVDATSVTVVTPAQAAGVVDVVLTTPGGSVSITNGFRYVVAPRIKRLTPSSGPATGGTMVTLTGNNLTDTSSVMFGVRAGISIVNLDASSVTVVTPPKDAGSVDVVLTTPGGSATGTGGFTYVAEPTITSVIPSSGPIAGGTAVTITGTNLKDTKAVMFGGTAGTSITIISATSVTVVTPKKSVGPVGVVLNTFSGSVVSTDEFTYVSEPTITSVIPSSGPVVGGTKVTITGTNLTNTSSVMFGGTPGTSITNVDSDSVTVITPGKAAGAVAVVVTGSGGRVTAKGAFMFSAAPSISASAASSVVQLTTPTEVSGDNEAPTEPDFFALSADSEVVGDVRDTLVRRGRKAVASVIVLLIIVATVGGYAVNNATRQSHKLEPVNREIRAANERVLQFAVATDLGIRSYLLSGERSYVSDFEKSRDQLIESVALLEREAARAKDQGLSQMVGNSSAILSTWLSTFADRALSVASADTPRGDQLAGGQLLESFRAVNFSILKYVEEVNAKAVAVAERVRRQTIAVAALVVLISFLVVAVLLVKEASDVSYPLINMRRVVNRIYRGDSSTRADELVGPAEIRAVARAVNELAYQQETAHKWVSEFNLSKANFLNTVNHELRTPLTSITGYSEFLGDEGPLPDSERTRMAAVINRNAFRLNDLIDNMLTVLRIDSMEVRFKMSTFDIRGVIEESVKSFRSEAESRELSIVTDLGNVALIVRADTNEILRVIGNLISNAVKFSVPGGRIEVSAGFITSAEGKREVAFSVKDTGIGIVDAELPHIGSRFYRSSNAIEAAIPGTGLGLMIVDFIVHEHGGSWSLASSESTGTTVEVRLPLTGNAMSLELGSSNAVV